MRRYTCVAGVRWNIRATLEITAAEQARLAGYDDEVDEEQTSEAYCGVDGYLVLVNADT